MFGAILLNFQIFTKWHSNFNLSLYSFHFLQPKNNRKCFTLFLPFVLMSFDFMNEIQEIMYAKYTIAFAFIILNSKLSNSLKFIENNEKAESRHKKL